MRHPVPKPVRLAAAVLAVVAAGCGAGSRATGGTRVAAEQVGSTVAHAGGSASAPTPGARGCLLTAPNGSVPPSVGSADARSSFYGNGRLWTALWPEGILGVRPGGPGTIEPDGSLGMKFPWWRGVRGRLRITGRRLDAPARPLRAAVPEGYGPIGFQASGLIFATKGCWKVTGRVGRASLTFVTLVEKVAPVSPQQP
jgi:hypothetical protein